MKRFLEKSTPFGAVIAAAVCPACFPALVGLASALGLSIFSQYEKQSLLLMQILVGLSMIFAFFSYRRTKNKLSLATILASGALIFYTWYFTFSFVLLYTGFAGLIIGAIANIWLERKCPSCEDGSCSVHHAKEKDCDC